MTDAAAAPDHEGVKAGPAGGEGAGFPSIIIQGEALARIEAELSADTTAEYGGVLVGNAAPATNFVLIAGSLAAPPPARGPLPANDGPPDRAETAPAAFTVTAATLEVLARKVAATFPGQRIVGWYHSHPRSGVYLTTDDLSLQRAFFAQAWQVGYVFDSVYGQRGFFGWSGGDIVRVPHWEITTVAHAAGADLPVTTAAHTTPGIALGDHTAIGSAADPVREFGRGEEDEEDDVVGYSGASDRLGAASAVPVAARRPMGAWIAAAVAIMAIVIAAALIRTGDDDDPTAGTDTNSSTGDSSTESAESAESAATGAVTAATDTATTATTATTAEQTETTGAETSTTGVGGITSAAVQTPSSRVGGTVVACEQTAASTYEPLADCFVSLNNGNIMVFVDGSLRCADPNGLVVAAEAQRFTIGVPGDPMALVADDQLIPTCLNLTYAQNVLAGGSTTFDGLCGGFGIQINDATRRCFGQHPVSGAMVAVVRGADDLTSLVASCTTATATTITPLTWSAEGVGTAWRVDLVTFDGAQNLFTASASRDGATATTTFSCG